MKTRTLRRWAWVHKWSSLVSTAFLLMLCITGLPLIFHHEIDRFMGAETRDSHLLPGTPAATLDRVIAAGLAQRPGELVQFVLWQPDEDVIILSMAKPADVEKGAFTEEAYTNVRVNSRTAEVIVGDGESRLTGFLLRLHAEMLAGEAGKFFLGFIGLVFIAAIVSGVALYGPFMHKLEFGTVRRKKSARVRWLDLHNLLGVVTITWLLVVGATGVINSWGGILFMFWQFDQFDEMVGPYKGIPVPSTMVPAKQAVAAARAALPDLAPSFVAMPGSAFSSTQHFAVFLRGNSPLTERLLQPVLVHAATAMVTETRPMPWYMSTLFLSQPLHFGDYGGLPLKLLWALLDFVTIIVLCSGLYLWLARGRTRIEERVMEAESAVSIPAPVLRR